MSLSIDPEYLAKRGIKGDGGPLDDQYVDDSGLLMRSIRLDGGYYKLRGKADGGLVYKWEADLAAELEGQAAGGAGDG